MIHPSSLLFLDGHFETNPDYGLTDSDIHEILPYFPVLKAQHTRNSAPASRSLVLAKSDAKTSQPEPCTNTATNINLCRREVHWVWEGHRAHGRRGRDECPSVSEHSPIIERAEVGGPLKTISVSLCTGWWSRQKHHRFTESLESLRALPPCRDCWRYL